jgi:4-nitrophenyl phosphatase
MPYVLDLDGVIWLADDPIPGAAGAVGALRNAGEEVVFVTNNSNGRVRDVEAKLARQGIPAEGAVVSSAMVTAGLFAAGDRVLVLGGPGLLEELERAGIAAVHPGDEHETEVDAVAVGFHREFDYERMRAGATAVRAGARLVATNDDATYPTPLGPIPGCGSIVASIERASGQRAQVAGKPYQPMADHLRARLGSEGMVVGDRVDTDGRLATALGWRFGLVLTGVTTRADLPVTPAPDLVADDLAALVPELLRR